MTPIDMGDGTGTLGQGGLRNVSTFIGAIPDSAIYSGSIDDNTTYTGLTPNGDVLYTTDLDADEFIGEFDEYSVSIDVTADGNNQSGTGYFPALGFKLVNGNGGELFSYSDIGEWVNSSGDRFDEPDGTVSRIIIFDGDFVYGFNGETTPQPISSDFVSPITAQITAVDDGRTGGGGEDDAVYSCNATIELTGMLND